MCVNNLFIRFCFQIKIKFGCISVRNTSCLQKYFFFYELFVNIFFSSNNKIDTDKFNVTTQTWFKNCDFNFYHADLIRMGKNQTETSDPCRRLTTINLLVCFCARSNWLCILDFQTDTVKSFSSKLTALMQSTVLFSFFLSFF